MNGQADTAPDEAPECLIDSAWREAWRSPDRRPPWLWAEENVSSIPYSPIPGRFRSENSPWIREPMEAAVDMRIPCVSVIGPIQASKSTLAELLACYIVPNLPGPLLWLDQTDADAKDQSESRLQKLFDECPPVRALFHANRNKKKLDAIHFAHGMSMHILGASNKTNLQRRSVRWLIGDETWRWPTGHMAEAEARTTAFGWLGKRLFLSQGGEAGDDTDKKWRMGDCREWTFACIQPGCGVRQQFKWENVEWSKAAHDGAAWNFAEVRRTTALKCEGCGHHYEDSTRNRRLLNGTGAYVATNPNPSGEVVSFRWNALCASSWGMLAELYLRAKESAKRGDIADLKIFVQKRLALSWDDSLDDFKADVKAGGFAGADKWEGEGAISRKGGILRAPFDPALAAIPLRIGTVDCQLDHFWALARAWGGDGSSRLIRSARLNTWEDVEAFMRDCGVRSGLVFVDARHTPYHVYRKCAANGWTALMGDKRGTFPHKRREKNHRVSVLQRFYSTRRVVSADGKPCALFYWSNLNIKDILARLMRNQDPARGATWEISNDAGDEYLAQLDSERRVNDKGKWLWKQVGKRANHLWDCEAMNACAAVMLKIIGRESVAAITEDAPETKSAREEIADADGDGARS